MSPSLTAFEEQRWLSREGQPDLLGCLQDAYLRLEHRPAASFQQAQMEIIGILEDDARTTEPAYHNRRHVCDVVSAAALLLEAQDCRGLQDDVVDAVMTAALGHDIHHDGRAISIDGILERQAADAVTQIGKRSGLSAGINAFMEALIMATFPADQAKIRTNIRAGAACSGAEEFQLLLGDADVLASLTPGLGMKLSAQLREEWQAAGFSPVSPPDSPEGRRIFLGIYTTLSPAAQRLGVDRMVHEQLQQLGENRL